MFASLNALIIPVVYFFFPETAGRSLEGTSNMDFPLPLADWKQILVDMDVVFAVAYNEGVSPVGVSLRKDLPLAGSPEADEILGVRHRSRENVDEHSPEQREKGD